MTNRDPRTTLKRAIQAIVILAIFSFSTLTGPAQTTPAGAASASDSCGQLLADAEARFLSTLAPDGSVPATPETQAAAQEYIRVSKLCYQELEAQGLIGDSGSEPVTYIDDGGVRMESVSSAEFTTTGGKWGGSTMGSSGGTVTYSFMGNGLDLSSEPYSTNFGSSVAVSSLPGVQACSVTEIRNAFAAWQAVSNIRFVQVDDSGTAFNAAGASGDIRIGAHTFDGPSGVLAHAYFPPPNGASAAGDMHFDRAENWSCNTAGIDIGIVALHEIGHALGLGHEESESIVAVMNPYYNQNLSSLQTDDVNGAMTIYGAATLSSAPTNDDFENAKTVGSVPYMDEVDTTGATVNGDPTVNASCDNKLLNLGGKTVWYKFTPTANGPVYIDTKGTNYDTYIAVWTGNSITNLTLVACDDDTNADLQSQLGLNAQAGTTYYIQVAGYTGIQGTPPEVNPGGNLKFQVTSFEDVAGNYWAWRWIEGFFDRGITTGCAVNPLRYCPDREVTRAEMAVFLLRAKFGSTHVPTPAQTNIFADVPVAGKEWMQPWIEEFYEEGITTGCAAGPLRYCPERSVTRAEMAVFILRAKYGPSYQPTPAQTNIFADVPVTGKEWMQPWIEEFYEQGITTGCAAGPLRYCPERPVTRAEMAVFIDRAFSIPQLP